MPRQSNPPYREPTFVTGTAVPDETELKMIEAFIAGDMQAFKFVYNKYRERIFSYCLYMTGNKAQADDAFQEVFIRVYERREQLRESRALKKWLLLVARSVCLNLSRESKFTPDFIYLDDERHEHEGYSNRKELTMTGVDPEFPEEIFKWAFGKISPIYRDAFLLREIEGFSCEEVAELTGATVANVKVRIARAKKMLRRILAPHFKYRLQKMKELEASEDEPEPEQETWVLQGNKILESI